MGVDPNAGATGGQVAIDASRRWAEIVFGVFSINAALDRVALQFHLLLCNGKAIALGNANLLSNQINACDHFRHGMLHLDAGVHLHEVEIAVSIHQKLHGARPDIVDGLRGPHSGMTHLFSQFWVQSWARGFF